ncbi:hypothetical protein H8Z80_02900 [Blautia sp. BX19]|nr:hypothetical protein [Blautia tarda]
MESTVIGDFRCLYQKKNANRETCAAIVCKEWMDVRAFCLSQENFLANTQN